MTQVVSLSLSKELWEKGLRIGTEKWWCIYDTDFSRFIADKDEGIAHTNNQIPAPSTDELLAVMPTTIRNERFLTIKKTYDKNFIVIYQKNYLSEDTIEFIDKSLPEALSKACLWLLNNGYHYNPETKRFVFDEKTS